MRAKNFVVNRGVSCFIRGVSCFIRCILSCFIRCNPVFQSWSSRRERVKIQWRGGWSTLFKPITPSGVKIGIGLN